jgi:uncharacterized membrane protein YqaE (UPF0057 family)
MGGFFIMRSLLAVICPPLAVLATGTKSQAAKNACLTMLLYVPGVIHALNVVERRNVERQYEHVFEAMDRLAAA